MEEPEPQPPTLDPLERFQRFAPFERLFERRIVFLRGALEDTVADELIAQLLSLDHDDDADVQLYIDSPGGTAYGMFAIHDVVQSMRSIVHPRCVGLAASAGGFLLATGTGVRSATGNARIMLHQPIGGVRGTAVDITIQARESKLLRERMEEILAARTGQPVARIRADLDRDYWMSAEEARKYGAIDEVVAHRHQ